MSSWKKFLILSAGFLIAGLMVLYCHESIIETVGLVFFVTGLICLCVPVTYFFKKAYQKLGVLKLTVLTFALYFSWLIIECKGREIFILLIWVICMPYLARRKPLRFL
jgi:hypothetical protein